MHLLLASKDALTTEKTEEMFLPWFTLFANVLPDIDSTIVNLEGEKPNEEYLSLNVQNPCARYCISSLMKRFFVCRCTYDSKAKTFFSPEPQQISILLTLLVPLTTFNFCQE